MQTLTQQIEQIFLSVFAKLDLGLEIMLTEATKPEFGDFQINGIMKVAKLRQINPRELAHMVITHVEKSDLFSKLEVAGPGFINIFLDNAYLSSYLNKLNAGNRYGVEYLKHKPEHVVVDLSSPNLAKEMHVGHLRSTVIGEALAKMLEYMGDVVIRQNHVGDWGTQFGMLIAYLDDIVLKPEGNLDVVTHELSDLEKFYRAAKLKFDADENFANKSRQFVVILQNHELIRKQNYSFNGWAGIEDSIKYECIHNNLAQKVFEYWQEFRRVSLKHCQIIYDELNIPLDSSTECARGESWYNDKLNHVLDQLKQQQMLQESDGAQCVFFVPGEISNNEEPPMIVQKNDGGFLYATTDLATVEFRVQHIMFPDGHKGASRIVYVVDARQALHFKQVFFTARKALFTSSSVKLEHAQFGTMMNDDGTPFKTRDGSVVKLIDLINEAKLRAYKIVETRNPEWCTEDKHKLANILAIGAIKYADLSKNRSSDYIFSFDKMLAFEGNTAPYLLYACTRIQSLLRKAEYTDANNSYTINITEMAEHKLGLHLAKFADMLNSAIQENYPHYVAQYVYNLAGLFMQFYEICPILKGVALEVQQHRLQLSKLTAEILETGLEQLLGIKVAKRM